jgi:hypothetical protein
LNKVAIFLVIIFGLWTLKPSGTFAGRPLITEDAGTVEKGFFELELAADYFRENNADKNFVPSAQLAYGLTERAEVAVGSGYIFKDIHDNGREDGWADVVAYVKYRVWEEGTYYPAFTIKPQLKILTASERKGLGSGKADYSLVAVFSKSFERMNLHFNLGYTHIGKEGPMDELILALAAEYEVKKGLLAVGEIRGGQNLNSYFGDDPWNALLGLQFQEGKVILDAAVYFGLNRAAPDYGFTAGITIKFQ